MNNVNNFVESLFNIYSQPLPLMIMKRIWIGKFKKHGINGFSHYIEEGDQVCVDNGKLIDCLDLPTHIVTCCKGRIGDTDLEVTVMDLKTQELSIIKLN